MATIDFRGWRLQSDPDCWVLGRPKTRRNKKQELEIFIQHPTYHATLDSALHMLMQRELREADTTTAAELLAFMRQMKQDISAALALELV